MYVGLVLAFVTFNMYLLAENGLQNKKTVKKRLGSFKLPPFSGMRASRYCERVTTPFSIDSDASL